MTVRNPTMHRAQYTPPTRLNCRDASRRRCVRNSQLVGNSLDKCEQICRQRSRVASYRRRERQPSAVVTQFTISCAVELLIEVGDRWRHSDVIVEKVVNIDETSRSQTAMESQVQQSSFQIVIVRIRRQSSRASCEFILHTADADATQLDSWVASAVCIGYNKDKTRLRGNAQRYGRSVGRSKLRSRFCGF